MYGSLQFWADLQLETINWRKISIALNDLKGERGGDKGTCSWLAQAAVSDFVLSEVCRAGRGDPSWLPAWRRILLTSAREMWGDLAISVRLRPQARSRRMAV